MTAKNQRLLQPFKRIICEKINEGYSPDSMCLEYGNPSPYKEKQGYFLTWTGEQGKTKTISGIIRSDVFKDETDLKKLCRDMNIQYCL